MDEPSDRDELFVSLMTANQHRLRAFLVAMVRRQPEVDDLLQETALIMWKKRDRYDPQRPFTPWAFGVASNVVARHRRRVSHEKLMFDEDIVHTLADAYVIQANALDLRREELAECLKKLPTADRGLIQDRYLRGKSVAAIATDLQRPEKTVYWQLRNIRDKLYACITVGLQRRGHPKALS